MERYKNRWTYALVAFICSFLVLPIMGLIVGGSPKADIFFISNYLIEQANFIGFPAAIAALICWPSFKTRTMNRMTLAGILTVVCTFAIMTLFMTVRSGDFLGNDFMNASLGLLFLGSIFTYGIPYIIAVIVSLAFVDHSVVKTVDES